MCWLNNVRGSVHRVLHLSGYWVLYMLKKPDRINMLVILAGELRSADVFLL